MLSETDIHYITGFLLYLTADGEDASVVLGEKVFDNASESNRDVDIVIATSGHHGLIATEVKDESRPLHVGIVEGICQKFEDMPSITDRSIVSASGFSGPAVAKASAHQVRCLRIVRGPLPRFATIDLSHLSASTLSHLEWREGPNVTLLPNLTLSDQQLAEIADSTPVRGSSSSAASTPKTLRALADRVAAAATAEWRGPTQKNGVVSVNLDVELADEPVIDLPSGSLSITDARVTGVVEWVTKTEPLEATCYLETLEGVPLAVTILMKPRTGLLGLAVSASSQVVSRLSHSFRDQKHETDTPTDFEKCFSAE